jgi:tRNA1(Val) A37 N6-methylase TrmN6
MPDAQAITEDRLLDGRVRLKQPRRGHRAGTDAVLLAACVAPKPNETVVDLGAGTGAVAIMIGTRAPVDLVLVEREDGLVELCRENLRLNGLSGRVVVADILASRQERRARGLVPESADWVATNPPFLDSGRARPSPDPDRSAAHLMPADGLGRWLDAAHDLLKPKGRLALIHRADALAEAFRHLAGRFGGVTARAVHPRGDATATRVLLTATKGSRGPLTVAAPLVLHEVDGTFTPLAEVLHRGETSLA